MKLRVLTVFSVAALLVATVASMAGASAASPKASAHRAGAARAWHTAPNITVLYNQLNNAGGVSLLSQDFTDAGFDIYDSYLADDFSVPGTLTQGWRVQGMRAVGVFFNGPGPCVSETVNFYKDAAGLPGAQQGTTQTGNGTNNAGTYTLVFPTAQTLAKGATYWASMYCTMAFASGGEWGITDRTVTSGQAGAWENPGGGFGVCPTWDHIPNCFGGQNDGNDLVFALAGAAR